MRQSIELCGTGEDAEFAAKWAEDRARDARLSERAIKLYGDRVRVGYEAACASFVAGAGDRPVMRITLEKGVLTPKFELVKGVKAGENATPRATRNMKLREQVLARRAQRAANTPL
ncbi:MAG: hypothetical protein AAGF90_14360 [Pseudomonadota bacterium]